MANVYVFLIGALGFHILTAADDWGYWGEHGPATWPGICTTGKKQSPINIVTEKTIKKDLGTIKFVKYDSAFAGQITNTGHSVQIRLDDAPIHLKGGRLPSSYILEQMHFHWGAEHTIDGTRDALELHFVHYNSEYGNVTAASQYANGIAVVATLFELSNEDNKVLTTVLKGTELVSKWVGKSTATLDGKIVPSQLLPKDHTTYYRYDGSLTTPDCQEAVMWFVLTEKLTISEQQLSIFRNVSIRNGTLTYNYRPVQALSDRKVYHHLDGYSSTASLSASLTYTVLGTLLARLVKAD